MAEVKGKGGGWRPIHSDFQCKNWVDIDHIKKPGGEIF